MKLSDLLEKLGAGDYITLATNVCGVSFEARIWVGNISEELARKEIAHISVRDSLPLVTLQREK